MKDRSFSIKIESEWFFYTSKTDFYYDVLKGSFDVFEKGDIMETIRYVVVWSNLANFIGEMVAKFRNIKISIERKVTA